MKRLHILVSFMIISLVTLSLVVSCASPSPSQTGAPQVTSTTIPASTSNTMKLIFSATDPEEGLIGNAYHWWANEVNKRTNGAITIQFYWNSSLVKMPETLEALQKGVADISNVVTPFFATVLPLHANLDALTIFQDKPVARVMANNMFDELVPEAKAEWTNAGIVKLFGLSNGNYEISSMNPISKISDFKGLKIRATGPLFPVIVKSVGATPVGFTHEGIYDALIKGTVDGSVTDYDLLLRFKEIEVVKYLVQFRIGSNPCLTVGMKADVWNKLSPDVQKIFKDLCNEFPLKCSEFYKTQFMDYSIPAIKAKGINIVPLSTEDMQFLKNNPEILAVQNNWVNWVSEKNAKISKERIEEIKNIYLKSVEEMVKLYPDTLEP
jgi:TRAP-type transport system periplasmic protein